MPIDFILLGKFLLVAIIAREFGHYFARFNLPHITGYLAAGVLVGPFAFEFLPKDAAHDLRFIDELSLAVIAFVAGSELYLKELQSRMRSIIWTAAGQIVAMYALGGVAIFFLTAYIPFMKDFSTTARLAASLLATTILITRSPASILAVIKEMQAKGPFTKTILGVTVSMDVIIIALFAVSSSLASALLTDESLNSSFVVLLILDLSAAIALGIMIGRLLTRLLATKMNRNLKTILILAIGFSMFLFSFELHEFARHNLPIDILIEPLLAGMVASFYVTNYSSCRDEFTDILHDVSPLIYVAFFTLTGVSLKIDVLMNLWLVALALFAIRLVGLFAGSFSSGMMAGESMRHNRILWMAFIPQAGVALGLAREVAVEFPIYLGDEFATMIIAVIVLNEIVGPLFLRFALQQSGEAYAPGLTRNAVIIGIEGHSIQLARRLQANNWKVRVADCDPVHVERITDIDTQVLTDISLEALKAIISDDTDVVVSMLSEDNDNYNLCKLVTENFELSHVVTRLYNPTRIDGFSELGVLVINPGDAVVNTLDQFVRAPQSASLFLNTDPNYRLLQITVLDPDIHNIILRDLRLPPDVLILGIWRDGVSIVPHGHTVLKLHDEITLYGSTGSMMEIQLRLGHRGALGSIINEEKISQAL